jgi:hypothetical protein
MIGNSHPFRQNWDADETGDRPVVRLDRCRVKDIAHKMKEKNYLYTKEVSRKSRGYTYGEWGGGVLT